MDLPLPKVLADVGPGGPLVTALNGVNSLAMDLLKEKYYAPEIQSQINNRNALTAGQNIENQYMPEKLQLQNALAKLNNQYYVPKAESEIASRNALANKVNTMTPLEAQELQLKNQWYPKNQEAINNFKMMGGSNASAGQKELMGFKSQLAIDHPEWDKDQINQATNAYLIGDSTFPDGTVLPPISGAGKDYLDLIEKRKNTAQGLNQQRYALTVDNLLDQGEKLLPNVVKYSGALGKAKGSMDAVASSLGQDTPEYNDYLYFTRTVVPLVAGEMIRALGVNASDTQKKMYKDLIDPTYWDQNPQGALQNYKRMKDLVKGVISKTVAKSTSDIQRNLSAASSQTTSPIASDTKYQDTHNKPLGAVGMVNKKGELYFIPQDKIKDALAAGLEYEK